MLRIPTIIACLVAHGHFLAFAGCSAQPRGVAEGGAYDTCQAFTSDADLSVPVSFTSDLAPIFQKNCTAGGSNCHGTRGNLPYLGTADGGDDAAVILDSIVDAQSPENPAMLLVAPSDPGHSYLMYKLDGDQCTQAPGCATSQFPNLSNCGRNMPYGMATLPTATRDAIRAWIQQGAANN